MDIGRWVVLLGAFLMLAYLGMGLGIGIFTEDWSGTGERVFWFVLTLGGAAVLAAGLWLARTTRSRGAAAALLALGAVMGAVAMFWSILGPLLAIALVVLAFLWARRPVEPRTVA
jgi:hypothetical protein